MVERLYKRKNYRGIKITSTDGHIMHLLRGGGGGVISILRDSENIDHKIYSYQYLLPHLCNTYVHHLCNYSNMGHRHYIRHI